MKTSVNKFKCEFPAKSVNEGLARMIAAAFAGQLDPRIVELADIKTIVSEAVTNCIVHGYKNSELAAEKRVIVMAGEYFTDGTVVITVKDKGVGIEDIEKAMEPMYTTDAENERSGMGFTIMSTFSDRVKVNSKPNKGTTVKITKKIHI